jgi:NO-binding membrane sensor protein with MHYT domain/CheY-like chemotaxis protein
MIAQSFSPILVAISVAIACLASYTALDLAGRVTLARERNRLTWLIYASTAMGLGIWSMHFVGMLALELPIALAYDAPLVLVSALIAIAAAFLAMVTVSRADLPIRRLLIAGAIMGVAIAGMHYTGMAAMRMPASIHYSALPVALSVAIAVSASCIALSLAFRYRHDESLVGRGHRALGALVMGVAIAGMHYTGMSAAHFMPGELVIDSTSFTIPTGSWLTIAVIAGTLLVLVLALVGASVDRHNRLTLAEYARLRQLRDEMEATVERRTAELQAALASAERANLAKSDFLAHMSHELRTPLNSVIGFADILLRNKNQNQRPQDLIYIERIGANGRHLLSLINNVLDLAKVESGHVELDISQLSIAALIEDVISQLGGGRDDRRVPLRTDIAPNLAPISTDAAKMRQILVNLIGNADKFTESGSITIRVVTDDDCPVPRRIDVIDTGVGIPADRLQAIFRPFEQADTSTTRKYGGTGLGLPITLAMCELLGAELTLASVVGEGSVFSITLPREALPVRTPTAEYAVAGSSEGETPSLDMLDRQCSRDALVAVLKRHSRSIPTRVLVIEDERDAQEMLLHHLRNEENVETMIADSGITAIQVLGSFVPDLILLDVRMPKMDGLVFLKHMRSDPLYAHIPVVVVTGEELTIAEREQLMAQSLGIVDKGANLEHAVHSALVAVAKHFPVAQSMTTPTLER